MVAVLVVVGLPFGVVGRGWGQCEAHSGLCAPVNSLGDGSGGETLAPEPEEGFSYMFSFGANIGSKVFEATGVKAVVSVPAILNHYCLVFNARVGYEKDTVFANVKRSRSNCVHGVVHKIATKDLEAVFDVREQCHVRKPKSVVTYGGVRVKAEVYFGNNGSRRKVRPEDLAPFKPTERYLKLLYCGAKERKLDEKYVRMLRKRVAKLTKMGAEEGIDCDDLKTLPTPEKKSPKEAKCPWGGREAQTLNQRTKDTTRRL